MPINMRMAIEFVDICPHCESVNIYDDYDVDESYVMVCRGCGERILRCDACSHAPDNTDGFCDWHVSRKSEHYEIGKCFRGITVNRR